MARARKSWREKLHDGRDLPKVIKITPKMSPRWPKGTVVIPKGKTFIVEDGDRSLARL